MPAPLLERTLFFVSTDAGAYGGAGATRFARHVPARRGRDRRDRARRNRRSRAPPPRIAGDRSSSPARTLVSTASARVAEQAGRPPSIPSVLTQLVDLGIPFAAGEQAPVSRRGRRRDLAHHARSGRAEHPRGRSGRSDVCGSPRTARTGDRGARRLDRRQRRGRLSNPDSLFLDERAASGWTVRLTLVVAVVPFVLGVLDLLVRGRRRRLPLLPGIRALRTRLLLWLYGGFLVWVGGCRGCLPDRRRAPAPAELVVRRGLAPRRARCPRCCLRARLAGRPPAARPDLSADPGAAARGLHRRARVARRGRRRRGAAEAVRARVRPAVALRLALASASPAFWSRIGVYLAGLIGPVAGSLAAQP